MGNGWLEGNNLFACGNVILGHRSVQSLSVPFLSFMLPKISAAFLSKQY